MKKLVLILLMVGGCYAQSSQPVIVNPKCSIPFTFTSTTTAYFPSIAGYDNRQSGCTNWAITYSNFGFASVSLVVQSASMGTVSTAGSFSTFAGSVASGINPNTATTQALTTMSGYYPWIRVTATLSGTGTLRGWLIGTLPLSSSGGGGGGGGGGLCPGGSSGQVQYNSSGNCAGTSGLTATSTRVLFADGAIATPSIAFGTTTTLGFYKLSSTIIGFPDNIIQLVSSGDTTQKFNMNYNNFDAYETIGGSFDFSFRDKVTTSVYGILSGIGLTFGPFGSVISAGNSVAFIRLGNNIGAVQNSTGQEVDLQLRKNFMLAVASPSTPSAGYGSVYVDSTAKVLSNKDDAGVITHTIETHDCGSGFVQKVDAAGLITCASASGSGTVNSGTQFQAAYYASNGTAVSGSTNLIRRTQCLIFGANNATAVLADADLGPQSRQYFLPYAATLVEMEVAGDGGTPNIILGRSRAGSIVNLTSSALATAGSGGIACSNTGGTTGIDGATTCSNTLQNTSWNAGDWVVAVSGTAGGVAKEMTACLTFNVN